jgi:hypothetical protein
MEHPGSSVNFSGAERAPYFHQQQDMVQPMCRGQPLNVVPPWGGDYSYSPGGYQGLQREYEIHRQHMLSLEHRYMESVQRRARLEMLIAHYGSQ